MPLNNVVWIVPLIFIFAVFLLLIAVGLIVIKTVLAISTDYTADHEKFMLEHCQDCSKEEVKIRNKKTSLHDGLLGAIIGLSVIGIIFFIISFSLNQIIKF